MDLQSYIQLKEAYANVHAPREEVITEVTTEEVDAFIDALLEEGYDLSEFTWDEVREAYLEEQGGSNAMRLKLQKNNAAVKAAQPAAAPKTFSDRRNARRSASPAAQANTNSVGQNIKTTEPAKAQPVAKAQPTTGTKAQPTTTARPANNSSSSSSSSVQKAAPARDRMAGASKADRMGAWAKANPKLAAAQKQRDATRGTSATTNPLMKDLKSRMPKPAAPNKPATTPKPATTTKPTTPVADSSPIRAMSKTTPTPSASNPKATPIKPSRLNKALSSVGEEMEFDSFDIILEYLVDSGFPQQEALVIMAEMSEEKREEILENRRAARSAGGYEDDSKKQTDPSKDGFTGISGSIEDIMRQSAEMDKKKKSVKEGMRHRDAETGEVTDKPEIGRTYYPHGERQKSSVALRKEKERAAAKKKSVKEEMAELAEAYRAVYSEEASDTKKDKHLERGGHSAKTDYSNPPKTGNTFGKKPSMSEKDRSEAMAKIVARMKGKK